MPVPLICENIWRAVKAPERVNGKRHGTERKMEKKLSEQDQQHCPRGAGLYRHVRMSVRAADAVIFCASALLLVLIFIAAGL